MEKHIVQVVALHDTNPKETENFLDWCSVFSAENSVAFTLTIAGEAAEAPEYIARYMD